MFIKRHTVRVTGEAERTRSPTVIGIPRALLFHKYAPMWTSFFQSLGCKVVISPQTNRQILDQGIRHAIDENCLAVKIFLGHVHYLIDKVDYLFIPHIECLHPEERTCVKLFGMPDIIRNTFRTARVLEYDVNLDKHQHETAGLIRLGLELNDHLPTVRAAVKRAQAVLDEQQQEAIEEQIRALHHPSNCRVLIVAHAYVVEDALMGKMISRILKGLDVDVIYADRVEQESARTLSLNLSTDCYWTYSKELLGGIETYRSFVDGIIFLMAFPCGPDSLIYTLCQHVLHDIPLCVLNLDELQGDAGIKTRLESFIDILRLKKEKPL